MEQNLKSNRKQVWKDFGTLGNGFRRTFVKTVKKGAHSATKQANKKEDPKPEDIADFSAENPASEQNDKDTEASSEAFYY